MGFDAGSGFACRRSTMRTRLRQLTALYLMLLACASCDPALVAQLDLVTASDLAGTYTGVLEGVSVSTLADLEDPERQVIVDLDLLHQLTIRETGALTVTIQSPVIPPLRAIVVGSGPVAVNAEFVEFEGLDLSNGTVEFDSLKVKQIVFVRHEGEWIVVLQLVKVGALAEQTDVYVYQYVSDPAKLATQLNEHEAIRYVNDILRLISAAQRGSTHLVPTPGLKHLPTS